VRLQLDGTLTAAAAFQGGRRVMVAATGAPCGIFDLQTGERVFSPPPVDLTTRWLRLDLGNSRATLYGGGRVAHELPTEGGSGPPRDSIRLPVDAVAASADGKRLVSRAADGSATVTEVTGRTISTTPPHAGEPHWTALSPDGKWVVTGGRDRIARVWDADTGKEVLSLVGHNAAVTAAAVSPDRARIATASHDGVVKVWDGQTGHVRLTFPSHAAEVAALSWAPDGKQLIAANVQGVVQVFDGSPVP
jgi:WD40 repeat protein